MPFVPYDINTFVFFQSQYINIYIYIFFFTSFSVGHYAYNTIFLKRNLDTFIIVRCCLSIFVHILFVKSTYQGFKGHQFLFENHIWLNFTSKLSI